MFAYYQAFATGTRSRLCSRLKLSAEPFRALPAGLGINNYRPLPASMEDGKHVERKMNKGLEGGWKAHRDDE